MSRYANIELDEAIESNNLEAVEHLVTNLRNDLMNFWIHHKYDELETCVRIATSKLEHNKRKINFETANAKIINLIGIYEGVYFYFFHTDAKRNSL